MNIAIIGMGNMGCNYAQIISQNKISGMSLVAVTRIKVEKFSQIQNCLPKNLQIFDSANDLFLAYDNKKITFDAVIITTPNYSHEEIACQAFARGISVLCDKPAGVYSRQARQMLECFEKNRIKFTQLQFGIIFQQRTNPVYKKMKEIVESKKYGNIKRVNWVVTDWFRPNAYYNLSNWKAKWKTDGGGVILNQCPHNLDLLQWICGIPSTVQSFCYEGKYHPIEVEDEATVYFEWQNGATGTFITSTGEAAGINRFEITFENAYLICENNLLNIFELNKTEQELQMEQEDFFSKPKGEWKSICVENDVPQYEELLQNFAKKDLVATGFDGFINLLITNAIYLSSWKNQKIKICQNDKNFEKLFEEELEKHIKQRKNYFSKNSLISE